MTWLKIWPSRRAVNMLLSAYATIAERLILGRLAAGLPMSYPTQVAPFKTKAAWIEGRHDVAEEEAEEEEAEEEAEAEPVAGAAPSAKQARRLQHFVDAFMALYRDLRSTRHTWKPDATSYSDVVRFYAALGDSDAALRVYNATNTAEAPLNDATRGGLILSLVVAGKAVEGLALAQQTGRVRSPSSSRLPSFSNSLPGQHPHQDRSGRCHPCPRRQGCHGCCPSNSPGDSPRRPQDPFWHP